MSDINCAKCGEPWDYWGMLHGDMSWWEAELFKKGSGCPCCKGEGGDNIEKHLRSVIDNSDDPDSFEQLYSVNSPPFWEEPEPKVSWECSGCGIKAIIPNDTPLDGDQLADYELEWSGGNRVFYKYGTGPYSYDEVATDSDASIYLEREGKKYCSGCATECYECGEVVLIGSHQDDCDSYVHPHDVYSTVCYDCCVNLYNEEEEEEEEE